MIKLALSSCFPARRSAANRRKFSAESEWTIPLAMLLAFAGLEILVGYMAGRPIVIPAASTPAEKL